MEHKLKIHNSFGFQKDIYFSEPIELWIDLLPNQPKECKRILLMLEPEEISGLEPIITGPWQHEFDLILTHNSEVLNKCKNAVLHEFGTCWIRDFEFNEKKYAVSTLVGGKQHTINHRLRHTLIELQDKNYDVILEFYNSVHNPYSDNTKLLKMKDGDTKKELFNYQFHIAIENSTRDNWFSEKLIDCFQTKTIPIYLGCPNISKWFNTEGMFIVNSISDIDEVLSKITKNTYDSKLEFINDNYERSKEFVDFGVMVENKLRKILNTN